MVRCQFPILRSILILVLITFSTCQWAINFNNMQDKPITEDSKINKPKKLLTFDELIKFNLENLKVSLHPNDPKPKPTPTSQIEPKYYNNQLNKQTTVSNQINYTYLLIGFIVAIITIILFAFLCGYIYQNKIQRKALLLKLKSSLAKQKNTIPSNPVSKGVCTGLPPKSLEKTKLNESKSLNLDEIFELNQIQSLHTSAYDFPQQLTTPLLTSENSKNSYEVQHQPSCAYYCSNTSSNVYKHLEQDRRIVYKQL